MLNNETAQRGPKAPVRSHSSREQEGNLRAWITPEIRKIARRCRHEVVSDDYDVDQDLVDLEDVGERYRKVKYKAFEYLVMTPIRAEANGKSETLLSRLRKHLDVKKRNDQTIYHLLAHVYLGVKEPATISMWARAAEYAVAHLHTDETVREFLKRVGGIRACADAARRDDNNEADDEEESDDPRKPKPKLDPKVGAGKRVEATDERHEDRRSLRSMPANTSVSRRKQKGISPADCLDEDHGEGDGVALALDVKFSEKARNALESASYGEKGIAHVTHQGDAMTITDIRWADDPEHIIEQVR